MAPRMLRAPAGSPFQLRVPDDRRSFTRHALHLMFVYCEEHRALSFEY